MAEERDGGYVHEEYDYCARMQLLVVQRTAG